MKHATTLLSATLALSAQLATAQMRIDPAATRLRGTVEKVDARQVTVKSVEGTSSTAKLASDTTYAVRTPATLTDIKPGDFVASAAVKGKDGKLHSTELRIFPEALRGLGEGQRPMAAPDTMMTNATVSAVVVPPSEVVVPPEGRVLKVKYKEGDSELVVGPEVQIVKLVPTPLSELKVGTEVTVIANKAADGSLTAQLINAN
ncbi:MAG: hypothetical protein ABIT36_08880 [Steroidobacteraceae bacterium]